MPYRSNRALRLRPVNSLKHVVDVSTSAVAGVVSTIPVVVAVDNPVFTAPADVHIGCTVSAIFLRVEVLNVGGAAVDVPRVYMAVQKNPGNEHPAANPSSIGDSDLRKFIIHQEMTMTTTLTGNDSSFPRTMFQGVIRIPPRLKRFGVNDRLIVTFAYSAAETSGVTNVCIQCIYKEFF